ncbi:MAG: hypothetical protein C0617_04675 [Desulfuromonas sp.]|uniref:c(7)-type cytochrome triheme domain-containing protein n=1 Tax=Desulfuromonas sp. TaxID=892 RepID=UPI000CC38EE9|nr:c(7)-type cytochrome triheme domain-containing protein [Desulfuromonas sp.]PLX85368.1 MAG: hypothetical protein C0617_04675 [Desulfuromonas sp.]
MANFPLRPIFLAALALLCWPLIAPPTGGAARAMNREELAQVLRTIPPNGPAEHYGDTIMRPRGKARMDPVVFPHWSHRARYTCRVCHLELKFSIYQGETPINRGKNLAGKFCGACHDGKTAFSVRNEEPKHCDRCHTRDDRKLAESFRVFAEEMPKAPFGNGIDWAAALEQGHINPVHSILPGNQPSMHLPEKLRRPLELGTTAPRSGILFSHTDHMDWLDCSNCHPDIFDIQKEGTQFFTMDKNVFGWFCGTCHMRTAFPMNDCNRCHPGMKNNMAF